MRKIRKRTKKERRSSDSEYREKVLVCPFCKSPIVNTVEIDTPFGSSVEGGHCACGAVFVYDRSGRMMGEAYMDALALAYEWDYDSAIEGADGGYEEAVIRYDERYQKYMGDEGKGLNRSPKYYFIKRKKNQ